MKHFPKAFNTSTIKALLDGKKTVIRLPLNVPVGWELSDTKLSKITSSHPKKGKWGALIRKGIGTEFPEADLVTAPLSVGDLIWVRETFATLDRGTNEQVHPFDRSCQEVRYKASENPNLANCTDWEVRGYKWRRSVHMPKHCSRLTLKITNVYIERLTEISEEQAISEGMPSREEAQQMAINAGLGWYDRPTKWFKQQWVKTYGENSWNDEQFVWVVEFTLINQNIANVAV